ncbi:MAG TPA: hypothetical protein V6D08_13685 [Candidatus Obscuribacterales bacterium]
MALALWLLQPASSQAVIERPVVVPDAGTRIVLAPGTVTTTEAQMRSNYPARLAHLLDQLNLGIDRGWLSAAEAAELKDWHARLVAEEAALRSAGGGIVSREHADVLERHLTGFSFMLTRYMNN